MQNHTEDKCKQTAAGWPDEKWDRVPWAQRRNDPGGARGGYDRFHVGGDVGAVFVPGKHFTRQKQEGVNKVGLGKDKVNVIQGWHERKAFDCIIM